MEGCACPFTTTGGFPLTWGGSTCSTIWEKLTPMCSLLLFVVGCLASFLEGSARFVARGIMLPSFSHSSIMKRLELSLSVAVSNLSCIDLFVNFSFSSGVVPVTRRAMNAVFATSSLWRVFLLLTLWAIESSSVGGPSSEVCSFSLSSGGAFSASGSWSSSGGGSFVCSLSLRSGGLFLLRCLR